MKNERNKYIIEELKELEINIIKVRNRVELGYLENEELYPLDTFRYKPEIIDELIVEIKDCIINYKEN